MTAWNPSDKCSHWSLSGSNLIATQTTSTGNYHGIRADSSRASGKYWFKITVTNHSTALYIGIAKSSVDLHTSVVILADLYVYYSESGNKVSISGSSAYGASFTTGDTVEIAYDATAGKLWFGKNGTWQASGDPAAGTNPAFTGVTGTYFPFVLCSPTATSEVVTAKFTGTGESLPSGFSPWEQLLSLSQAHNTKWGAMIGAQHAASWGNQLGKAHAAGWESRGLVSAPHDTRWGAMLGGSHSTGWSGTLGASQAAGWGAMLGNTHRSGYAARVAQSHVAITRAIIARAHAAQWSAYGRVDAAHAADFALRDREPVSAAHAAGFAAQVGAGHQSGWNGRAWMSGLHTTGWGTTVPVSAALTSRWTLLARNPVSRSHGASWRLISPQPQVITGVVQLRPVGAGQQVIPLESASLHCDEGSPYWQADLTLADVRDYARCPLDMQVDLEVYDRTYRLLVDNRQLSRGSDASGNPQESATLKCLSPGILYDSPRAQPITKTWGVVMAQTAAQEALALGISDTEPPVNIDWDIYDWSIPAGRLAVTDATPIAVAKQIIEAIGGVLESKPDGTLRARYRFPVKVADLRRVEPDLSLTEHTIYSVQETRTASRLIDRMRIVDVEATYQDRLEWEADEEDGRKGIVRAFPAPWREKLKITHTRNGPVHLYPAGAVLIVKTEIIEITQGAGSVAYPILDIQSTLYLADPLGAVSFSPFSTQVVTAVTGYSLLQVTYTTRALEYRAESEIDTKAQILLEDAGG